MLEETLPTSPVETQDSATPEDDATEAEQILAEKQDAIEAEAKALFEGNQPPQEPAPQPPVKPPVDYETRYKESQKEAIVLNAKVKQKDERLNSLNNPLPTQAELKEAFPNWDTLNEVTKDVYRRQFATEKRAAATQNMLLDYFEQQKWNEDFAAIVAATPALKTREADFKQYCYKPSHKNVPTDVLAKSFLYELKDEAPAPPAPKKPGLQQGSAGPKNTEADSGFSDTELAHIRQNDPQRYRELVKKGKI
jgi:hypothetical protein